jgi:hypothetical protein
MDRMPPISGEYEFLYRMLDTLWGRRQGSPEGEALFVRVVAAVTGSPEGEQQDFLEWLQAMAADDTDTGETWTKRLLAALEGGARCGRRSGN